MEKMKFDLTTRTATCNGFGYTLGSAAVAAEMKLVELEKEIGKVTYNPDVLELITACIMAECLYGVPAVSGDEPGTLILQPLRDECGDPNEFVPIGCRTGPHVSNKESIDWKPENAVPYISPYHGMALRAIESLKGIEDSPIGPPQFKIQSIKVHWSTGFDPDCMLGLEVIFSARITMESRQKFILSIHDRTIFIHPMVGNGNPYMYGTTLELGKFDPMDEDVLALQIFGVLNTYTCLTYEKVQEFFDQKMDWTEIEDGLPNECQNVKFVQAVYNGATELYEFTTGNGFYKDGCFWDPVTSQPVEVIKWKPRK